MIETKMVKSAPRWCRATTFAAVIVLTGVASTARGGDQGGDAAVRLLREVADHLEQSGVLPPAATDDDFYAREPDKETLGRLLFFDKALSGNRNISCATCHHPLTDTGDGLSLPVGEGARGLGMTRDTGSGLDAIVERVPRNAPHVFNLGAEEFEVMFHDGRVEVDPRDPGSFLTPAGDELPDGLENVLAAQAMFPVTSPAEMAGQLGENPIADAADEGRLTGDKGVWTLLANRLRGIPEYVTLFVDAFDLDSPDEISFVHAANAIAAYEAAAFRADDSPFDRYLRGDHGALSARQKQGMSLFYGAAGCAECHSGTFQTSHTFTAVAMPQIGPGKGDNLPGYTDGHDDFGRERVTGVTVDRFRFRVPSLRNVALTGPWGHDGAYGTLEAIVRHQLDPVAQLQAYDTTQAALPPRDDLDAQDFVAYDDSTRRAAVANACELEPSSLTDEKVAVLVEFLHALTDRGSLDLRSEVPMTVPSGLPVFE